MTYEPVAVKQSRLVPLDALSNERRPLSRHEAVAAAAPTLARVSVDLVLEYAPAAPRLAVLRDRVIAMRDSPLDEPDCGGWNVMPLPGELVPVKKPSRDHTLAVDARGALWMDGWQGSPLVEGARRYLWQRPGFASHAAGRSLPNHPASGSPAGAVGLTTSLERAVGLTTSLERTVGLTSSLDWRRVALPTECGPMAGAAQIFAVGADWLVCRVQWCTPYVADEFVGLSLLYALHTATHKWHRLPLPPACSGVLAIGNPPMYCGDGAVALVNGVHVHTGVLCIRNHSVLRLEPADGEEEESSGSGQAGAAATATAAASICSRDAHGPSFCDLTARDRKVVGPSLLPHTAPDDAPRPLRWTWRAVGKPYVLEIKAVRRVLYRSAPAVWRQLYPAHTHDGREPPLVPADDRKDSYVWPIQLAVSPVLAALGASKPFALTASLAASLGKWNGPQCETWRAWYNAHFFPSQAQLTSVSFSEKTTPCSETVAASLPHCGQETVTAAVSLLHTVESDATANSARTWAMTLGDWMGVDLEYSAWSLFQAGPYVCSYCPSRGIRVAVPPAIGASFYQPCDDGSFFAF